MTTYVFSRGETVAIPLNIVSGSLSDVASITANLRKLQSDTLLATSPIAATFTITSHAATTDAPAGWILGLTATQSRAIGAGTYQVDAHVTVGSGETITTPVLVSIKEPATP